MSSAQGTGSLRRDGDHTENHPQLDSSVEARLGYLDLLEWARRITRRPLRLLAVLAVCGVAALLVALAQPGYYRADATLVPELNPSIKTAGQFEALLFLQSPKKLTSPFLYPAVMESRTVFDRLLASPYPGDSTKSFRDVLQPRLGAGKSDERLHREFRKRLILLVAPQTQLVSVQYVDKSPKVAAAVVNEVIRLSEGVYVELFTARADTRVGAVERSIGELSDSLRMVEEAYEEFLENNRAFRSSPRLAMEEQRLRNRMLHVMDLLTEQIQKREVRALLSMNDVPRMQVLDDAVPPPRKKGPRRLYVLISALAVCLILAVSLESLVWRRRSLRAG